MQILDFISFFLVISELEDFYIVFSEKEKFELLMIKSEEAVSPEGKPMSQSDFFSLMNA